MKNDYQDLMNDLARELPHRKDLLEGVHQLVQKCEQGIPAIHIAQYTPNLDDFAQANMNALVYENNNLEDKNERLKDIVKGMAELL
ncbi:hypothetical protein [Priestia megaterium]|uniref:hypothetical protein n=1 Tax=Priestia megaterium TaxID=1404 RepID=UPI0011A616A9|nr:hypothetical protein [Priestia megaterium]